MMARPLITSSVLQSIKIAFARMRESSAKWLKIPFQTRYEMSYITVMRICYSLKVLKRQYCILTTIIRRGSRMTRKNCRQTSSPNTI